MCPLATNPEQNCQHDQQYNCGQKSPWDLATRVFGAGIQSADPAAFVIVIAAILSPSQLLFVGHDRRRNRGGVSGGLQVIGYGLIFVKANGPGIGAHEPFIKYATRQLVKFIFFQGLQHASPDFGRDGNFLERDLALLAFEL